MFNLKKLLSNPNFSYVIGLLFCLYFSIFLGYDLVKNRINHEAILKIINSLVWLTVFIFETALKWHDLTKPNLSQEIDKKPKNKLFSKKWYLDNLPLIIIMIMGMSVMINSLIILTIYDGWNTNYIVSDPKFNIIKDWSFILLGVFAISDSLKKIPKFHQIIDSKLLSLLQAVLAFSIFMLYLIYTSNLIESP
ncbi:hypothetical protein [Crocosphaera chwakensis]|uniref:Uncharacterized protein n=1 Tax=Crocosphaera chwakensis CCY0110 TaxID=391612 RepID=A3IWM5_9CHRO|nr:hypothetical protein [Crocosphaera chwakensis]EAZ89136.1 hypothetical protein CY0110_12092 [Crocosphaera chwakensis CCY0110]